MIFMYRQATIPTVIFTVLRLLHPCSFFSHSCHTFANHPLIKGNPNDPNFNAPSASCCRPAPHQSMDRCEPHTEERLPGFPTSQQSGPGKSLLCTSAFMSTRWRQDKQSIQELVVYAQEKDRSNREPDCLTSAWADVQNWCRIQS